MVLISFLGSITEDFNKFQSLFRNLFTANIKLALICERPTIYSPTWSGHIQKFKT